MSPIEPQGPARRPRAAPVAAIVTDDPGWHGARLCDALAGRGWQGRFLSLKDCRFELGEGGTGLLLPGFETLPDAVFVRGVPGGTLEEVVFYLDILHGLGRLGVLVYNDARAIERSVDKGMTSFLLHTAGVPTPPAWVLRDPATARALVERELAAGHDLVLKPLFGSQGEGLRRLGAGGEGVLPDPAAVNGIWYLQRFVPGAGAGAQDFRVFVIGGRAVAAMCRRAAQGWVTNVAQGASCHPAELAPDLRDLAERAAAALGMAYAGVDCLRDATGRPWVLEVNGVPAWRGLQAVSDLDIAAALVADLVRRRGTGWATASADVAALPDQGPAAARRRWAADAYREACALELAAIKPGNVHQAAAGHAMTVADFLTSAEVSAGPLTDPGLGLGQRIYEAVAATRAAVGCNTNLGICLLCAPLLQAALAPAESGDLRERLRRVLTEADWQDTQWLNRAILLAAPGGLGRSRAHDVAAEATATPLVVMAHAAHRDRIARQYVQGYRDLFERAVPLLAGFEQRWQDPAWAAAALYLDFLARYPDTHVARKLGAEQAAALKRRAVPLAGALARSADPAACRAQLLDLDRDLKAAGINPGTSADLTVACLLIARLQPLHPSFSSPADDCRDYHAGPAAPAPVLSSLHT